ncbi:phage head spike fiber domain-containing protein [Pseudomonas nitroreducens]|uniref:phage head spike fiber domain-containing protein n=1 Tax=Pseudomonas nitroreducens TaxID=46680 RepID=UPI000304A637|nr:hypothetical protein [Pseudomonas nitroreducens]
MALTQKNFADLITLSRNSSAWRFNAMGLLESVPANEPRFDYDRLTHQLRGLLIEEQRTNTFLNSGNLTLMNLNAGATWDEAPGMAPDGQAVARVLIMSGPASSGVYRTNASTNAGQQVWSVEARAITGNGQLRLQLSGTSYAATYYVDFDLINNRIIRSSGATGFISKVSDDGTYRVSITAPVDNPATPGHNVCIYAGDTTAKSFAVWGGQLETGVFPTSYIPTTTAQVTRAADIAYVGNTAPWFNPVAGTLYVEARPSMVPTGNAGIVAASLTSAGVAERIFALQLTATAVRGGGLGSGGNDLSVLPVTGIAPEAEKTYKGALAYAAKDARGAVNGVLTAPGAPAVQPGPITKLNLGSLSGSSQLFNGHIRNIRYYPRRLTDAELQALTA